MAYCKIGINSLQDPNTLGAWNKTFPDAKEFFPAEQSLYKWFFLNHPQFPDDNQEVNIIFVMDPKTSNVHIEWNLSPH